jgi:hypothetical protein
MLGLTHDWLRRLVGYSQQPGIACAGPVVLAADGRVEQAGIAIPAGLPLPVQRGIDPAGVSAVVRNVSAVSDALSIARATLDRLGGLRSEFADLILTDLGLRAEAAGLRNVVVPDVRLGLASCDYVKSEPHLLWRLQRERQTARRTDPYYSSRYCDDRGDFTIPPPS